MKRVGNLLPAIAAYENLLLAHYKAQKGKRAKKEVRRFGQDLNKNIFALQAQLLAAKVEVGNYHYFKVYDPKERTICAASYSERVLHHALMNVCHPYFEQYQIYDSYATRPEKGTFKALERAHSFHRRQGYYLKMDIRKYFDSISHEKLLYLLKRRFKDRSLMLIFEQIIRSYETSTGQGLPIGNLTSQYFANYYLAYLDHFIKEQLRVKPYVRYMDDFILWADCPKQLNDWSGGIRNFLAHELGLSLKLQQLNRTRHGVSFLGFRLFPHRIGLNNQSKTRFLAKVTHLTKKLSEEQISQAQYGVQVRAVCAFAQHADSKKAASTYFSSCFLNFGRIRHLS